MSKFKPLKLSEISEILEIELIGNPDELIFGLNRIDNAVVGELTFFSDKKYLESLKNTNASCVIIPKETDLPAIPSRNYLISENPYKSLVKLLNYYDNLSKNHKSGIHGTAIIGENCKIDSSSYIGPNVVLGDNCEVGAFTKINANSVIGDNCIIGSDVIIYPNVSIYYDTIIGNNTIIHSGAVIGSDGFGYLDESDGSFTKIPQLGNVKLGNFVEIGANTTIDRSLLGTTIISDGVKLDNLIQIGHNCEIGENTAFAAQTGIAGSTKIGKNCKFGGQVGIAGHIEITDGVVILAQSGVAQSITSKGIYIGYPIRDRIKFFRIEKSLDILPEIVLDYERKKKEMNKL